MQITLSNGWTLNVPETYQKKPLDILNKWVEALRSGKYKQGQRYLRSRNDTYCCLGVLLDLEGAQWELDRQCSGYYAKNRPNDSLYLYFGDSDVSMDGAISPCSVHDGIEARSLLAGMNDAGLGFHDIATVLEHVYVQTT